MVLRLLLGVLLLASTSVPTLRAAEQPSPPSPPKIVNGSNEPGYPAVGWFQAFGGLCTATLIGCQTVLTAAHCLCTHPVTGVDLAPAECASAGLLEAADKAMFFHDAGVFAVSSVAVHPERNPGSASSNPLHDLAVIRLASPVTGIAPAVINQNAAVADGVTGTIVGFGLTSGSASDLGIKRSGAITTAPCDIPGHVCWEFSGSQSNTCSGDSGGPLFVNTPQGVVLAGVTSFGLHPSCLANDFSYDADVFSDRAWIASAAGADLATGPVQCSALPNAGAANTSVLGRVNFVTSQATSNSVAVPAGAAQLRVGTSGNNLLRTQLSGPSGTVSCGSGIPVAYCEINQPPAGIYTVTVRNQGGGTVQVQTVFTLLGAEIGVADPDPPAGPWLTTTELPRLPVQGADQRRRRRHPGGGLRAGDPLRGRFPAHAHGAVPARHRPPAQRLPLDAGRAVHRLPAGGLGGADGRFGGPLLRSAGGVGGQRDAARDGGQGGLHALARARDRTTIGGHPREEAPMTRESQPPRYFAETAIGAVVLVAIQFLSLPVLVGGLALIGIAKLVSSIRTARTGR